MIARMLIVAAACLAPLAAGAKQPPRTTTTSHEAGFFYGPEIRTDHPAVAQALHDALTADGGPIEQLTVALEEFDNNPPGPGGRRAIGLQRWIEGEAEDGYTLFSSFGAGAFLVDLDGTVVKTWPVTAPPFAFPFPAKLLPEGHLIAGDVRSFSQEGHLHLGRIMELDWCGNVVWDWRGRDPWPMNPEGARWHHDFQREGSTNGYPAPGARPAIDGGRTWVLVHEYFPIAETAAVSDLFVLEEDGIIEVAPDGTIAWEWYPHEYVEQMGFTATQREAMRTNPIGADPVGATFDTHDWQHLNAISQLGPNRHYEKGDERFHPDNILWDGRSSNIIAIVARHDHPDGVTWKSGDIVWRTGPNYGPDLPEHRIGQIIGQHTAHMIPAGLPGHGNILVFDNGGIAGFGSLLPGLPAFWPVTYRATSRALEYDPVTMDVVWEYVLPQPKQDGPYLDRKFFSWYISSVQRLKNGNTLVMEGAQGRAFEVTREGRIVWEYIAPYVELFGGPGDDPAVGPSNDTYRAYRYPESYLPPVAERTCPAP